MADFRIRSIEIDGFRPFREFRAELGPLEVIAGANGSGKSSLFQFLRFLRQFASRDLPPEIVEGSLGQEIFHRPGKDAFTWRATLCDATAEPADVGFAFEAEITGPVGSGRVARERLDLIHATTGRHAALVEAKNGRGKVAYDDGTAPLRQLVGDPPNVDEPFVQQRNNASVLVTNVVQKHGLPYALRELLREWGFYSSLLIDPRQVRVPSIIDEQPVLYVDGSNLASVLNYLNAEHAEQFAELQLRLRGLVPGFRALSIKPRGGPGRVMAFWEEDGIDNPLTLGDLSDGTIRLLCWLCVALAPNEPPLVCIDEPDQGVHPRTLPVLAALFQRLSERTQVLLTTHSSYFLKQFELDEIAVMRKTNGRSEFLKPRDSATLKAILEDFGADEIEALHRSDELEDFA